MIDEEYLWEGGPTKRAALAHLLMALFLVTMILLDVKNYIVSNEQAYKDFSFFLAAGLPGAIMVLVICDLIYEKYLKPM